MRAMTQWALSAMVAAAVAGSASVAGASDQQRDESVDPSNVETRLAEVTAERDALIAAAEAAVARYEKSAATQQLVFEIIADPAAFGTNDEVLDRLDSLAVPGLQYADDAFGTVGWRTGWRNTLFGDVDATIHTWRSWLSTDGSAGGSMWTWSGTAQNGERFALQGINLDTYDQNGLMDSITVYYPFEDAEVLNRFYKGGGTTE